MTITTTFSTDRELINSKQVPYFLLRDMDDGFETHHNMSITPGLREMFEHKHISWERRHEERVTNSRIVIIGEFILHRNPNNPLEYYFEGNSEPDNHLRYRALRSMLEAEGYLMKFISCKNTLDCMDNRTYRNQTWITDPE
jgi:hypothetical protein